MQITRHLNARSFLDATRSLLDPFQAEAGLIYGLALRQIDVEHPDPAETLFMDIADDEGTPIFAILRSGRPASLIFGDPARWESAVKEVVPAIRRFYPEMNKLNGPREQVMAAVAAVGQDYEIVFEHGLYRLDELVPPKPCKGIARTATMNELDVLVGFSLGFEQEAMGNQPNRAEAEKATISRIESSKLWVWEDEIPVSIASQTRPTGRGVTIGYVYTPPEHRKNGYAGNLTAALSRSLLQDQGFEFCTLFTDMANPTSNKIYQAIGYYKIMDYLSVKFL